MVPVAVRPIAAAVEAHINDYAETAGSAVRVARGNPPAGTGWQGTRGSSAFVGYALLDSAGSSTDGPADEPDEDFDWGFMARCIGDTEDQAHFVGDLILAALRASFPTIDGRLVTRIQPEEGAFAITDRDDSTDPPLWRRSDRYTVMTTPN